MAAPLLLWTQKTTQIQLGRLKKPASLIAHPHVATLPLPSTHLWGNVVRCAKLLVQSVAPFAKPAGAKVDDLQLRTLVSAGQQDVLGLQVPAK
jgi:hypothetical protein